MVRNKIGGLDGFLIFWQKCETTYSQIRTKKDKAQLEKQKISGRINAMEQANKLVDDAVLLHLLP